MGQADAGIGAGRKFFVRRRCEKDGINRILTSLTQSGGGGFSSDRIMFQCRFLVEDSAVTAFLDIVILLSAEKIIDDSIGFAVRTAL